MPLTLERLADIRGEHLAYDLSITQEMCSWTEQQAAFFFESGGAEPEDRRYPRVWLTSDVHTDRENNMEWCRSLPKHPHGDVLIVAGDLSHKLALLEETLSIFVERFTRGACARAHPHTCSVDPPRAHSSWRAAAAHERDA